MIGLYYPLYYVIRTWVEHRLHGTYPEAGAYNDQDPQLMEDWHALDMKYAAVLAQPKEAIDALPPLNNPKNWMEL